MQEVLFIRGGSAANVLDMLAAASELHAIHGDYTQIDAAVPVEYADYVRLGSIWRRVIAVTPPDKGDWASESMTEKPEAESTIAGIGGKLFSAAKKISAIAGKNISTYWQLAEEVRITSYDVVFDFEFSPYSIAISKVARTGKIIGFDPQMLENPVTGAALSAHDNYLIKGEMSTSGQMRHLVARYFGYTAAKDSRLLDWRMQQCTPPADKPDSLYGVVSATVPAPFMEVIEGQSLPFVKLAPGQYSVSETAGLVQQAEVVVGDNVISHLAAAAERNNIFVGVKAKTPQRAQLAETPSMLAEKLEKILQSAAKPELAAVTTDENKPAAAEESAAETNAAEQLAEQPAEQPVEQPVSEPESEEPKKIKLKLNK